MRATYLKRVFLFIAFLTVIISPSWAQSPTLVADINPGTTGAEPKSFTVFNNKLYFRASTPASGHELWQYDGINPPTMVADLYPGPDNGVLYYSEEPGMAVFNNKLYFSGRTPATGYELYSYDGVNPPALAFELAPGTGDGSAIPFGVFDNKLICTGLTPRGKHELYLYDGVNPPVLHEDRLASIPSFPNSFAIYNGKLYYSSRDVITGYELTVYDPVLNTVSLVGEVQPGSGSSWPGNLTVVGGKLYFSADGNYGTELYSYDGTTINRLTDIATGSFSGLMQSPNVCLMAYNNKVYLSGSTDGRNYQLYDYDPATNTTNLFSTINPAGNSATFFIAVHDGKLYFKAASSNSGNELYSTDGTTTALVAEIYPGPSNGFFGRSSVSWNGALYFCGGNATVGYELYKLQTSTAGVQSVRFDGTIIVSPNPTQSTAQLELELKNARSVQVSLTDLTGRKVYQSKPLDCISGKTVLSLPMQDLSPGTYLYNLSDTEEGLLQSGQVIKQ